MNRLFRNAIPVLIFALSASFAAAQDAALAARDWLEQHHAEYGLTAKDAVNWAETDRNTDKHGNTIVYIRQVVNGLPVEGAVGNLVVKNNAVVFFGNRLQADVSGRVSASAPGLSAEDALRAAARNLGLTPSAVQVERSISRTEKVLGTCGISRDAIPAKLIYQPGTGNAIPLAWDLVIRETSGQHWWHVAVDAQTGEMLRKNDWIVHCAVPSLKQEVKYNASVDLRSAPPAPSAAMPPPDGSGYRVFAIPVESPVYGPQTFVTDPADPVASPNGWHDTNGVPGAEYTITRGNNAYAGEDLNDDDIIGYSPDGGSDLNFDFYYTPPQAPADYLDAAITNLFYTCNVLHDVWWHYGFDEQGGNFQQFNASNNGAENDAVYAQAQDGGGTNNANFGTPPDGDPGVMQMYLWRTSEADTFEVNTPLAIAGEYGIETAGFGPLPPAEPLTEDVVLVQDDTAPESDGCEAITNGAALAGKIALVDRGSCLFVEKVLALQAQGAVAVVVVNNVAGAPITMGGTDPGNITIPAVMISMADGQIIKDALLNGAVNATLQGAGYASLRDCDFDNGIIAHEYGHGVSNRLTGGPGNTDCLYNDEQMGEGWSDWMGMVLTMEPGDLSATGRGVGTFVQDEGADGPGIRPAPYSTDFAVNPFTYGITNTSNFQETHALGFVWATMLWDVTWALVDEVGFDPDLYNGTGGNNIAMQLVMHGMQLQPCEPGFVDGRDAILLADELDYGGEYACLLWNAFAGRGLGYSASQGSANSVNDQVEAFDLPIACSGAGVDAVTAQVPGFILVPTADGQMNVVPGSALKADATVRLIGMDGRLLLTQRMPKGSTSLTLDLNRLAHAAYVVELALNNGRPERNKFVY